MNASNLTLVIAFYWGGAMAIGYLLLLHLCVSRMSIRPLAYLLTGMAIRIVGASCGLLLPLLVGGTAEFLISLVAFAFTRAWVITCLSHRRHFYKMPGKLS